MKQHDLVVVGAGPGGYVAAIRAAQLGLNVACIEKEKALGGTCLRIGCIPSKALLESSELYYEALHGFEDHGLLVAGVKLDLEKMLARKDRVVKSLTGGVASLFKKHSVTRYEGTARFEGKGKLVVEGKETVEITAKTFIIATGSKSASLRGVEVDGDRIATSTEALSYAEVPKHLVVIGAGYIGLEMGSVWLRLGAKVKGKTCTVECAGAEPIQCDRVLVAVGRQPNTDGLGLDSIGLTLDEKGRVPVDEHFATSVEGVYAIGDVIRGPMLAHKAEDEGIACAEYIVTGYGHVNYDAIPGVVYTQPEIASVGKTEEQLKEARIEYRKGVFPFRANGRARALGHVEGTVKILADPRTDRVLGVHILGPRAGDLIAEAAVAIEFGASSEDIARSSPAHPTLADVVKEAALAVDGRAIHF